MVVIRFELRTVQIEPGRAILPPGHSVEERMIRHENRPSWASIRLYCCQIFYNFIKNLNFFLISQDNEWFYLLIWT